MKSLTKIFHSLADEGDEIAIYRKHQKMLSALPAKRIELILKLKELRKQFFIKQ